MFVLFFKILIPVSDTSLEEIRIFYLCANFLCACSLHCLPDVSFCWTSSNRGDRIFFVWSQIFRSEGRISGKNNFPKKNCVQGVLRLKLIVKYWLFTIKNWFAYSWQPTFCSVKIYFYEKKYLGSRNIYICTIGFFSHCNVLGDRRRLFQFWNGWTLL